jgi:hypothetical protein
MAELKAVRKLTNINFESEGSAVALVGKAQGGPANGRETLIFKSLNTNVIEDQDIEKASQVTVTMNIVDYLYRFFDLWYEYAEVRARVFGYDTTPDEVEADGDWWDNYIQEKVDAVTIIKSLVLDKDADQIKKAVAELSPEDYLKVIKSQEIFEKNIDKASASINKSSVKEGVIEPEGSKTPSVDKIYKEESMTDFISKSALESVVLEAVTKAVAVEKAKLDEAQEIIKQYKEEKKATVEKARKASIAEVEKEAEAAEALFKSLESVDDTTFDSVIKALKKKDEQLATSEILKETGSQGRQAVTTDKAEDATARILKQQFNIKDGE